MPHRRVMTRDRFLALFQPGDRVAYSLTGAVWTVDHVLSANAMMSAPGSRPMLPFADVVANFRHVADRER